jgi:hypothetical protein
VKTALPSPKEAYVEVKTETLPFPLLIAVYRAGVRRGNEEANAFDWGCRPAGKFEDELVDALHDYCNEGIHWEDERYWKYDVAERWVAERLAEFKAEEARAIEARKAAREALVKTRSE